APVEPPDRGLRHRGARGLVVAGRDSWMSVRIGVVIFPSSNRDIDAINHLDVAGAEPVTLWHDQATLDGVAGVLVPGGFAYGDYLRAGVIARFSPIVRAVTGSGEGGGAVPGICNGFQVLTEAHLLPGALLRNRGLRFVSRRMAIAAGASETPFTHRPERAV